MNNRTEKKVRIMPGANYIRLACYRAKCRLANRLDNAAAAIPVRSRFAITVAIGLVLGSFSTALVLRGVGGNVENVPPRPGSLVSVQHPLPGHPEADRRLDRRVAGRILGFRHYLDSLQQTPGGRLLYQKLLQRRPGLRDSLTLAERYYEKQLKTTDYGKSKQNGAANTEP